MLSLAGGGHWATDSCDPLTFPLAPPAGQSVYFSLKCLNGSRTQLPYSVWFVFLHCVATGGQHLHHEFTWRQTATQVNTLNCLTHTNVTLMLLYLTNTHTHSLTHTAGLSLPVRLLTDRTSCLWREPATSKCVSVCTSKLWCVCECLQMSLRRRRRPSPFPSQSEWKHSVIECQLFPASQCFSACGLLFVQDCISHQPS